MKLGCLIGPTSATPEPGSVATQARMLEGEGFDSLWVAQAVGRGMMVSDPLITLANAAAATEHIQLGTAVLQLSLYQPVELTHRIFSLMGLVGPRLRIGVGAGSTEADFRVFGQDFATRFARFNENLAILRDLLAHGKNGEVDLSPWENVMGGPPLLYGTWGKGVARAAREFSGWIASGLHRTDAEVIEALQGYRANGGDCAIVSTIILPKEETEGANRKRLDSLAEAGFDEAVVMLLPGGPTASQVRSWVGH